MATSVQNYTLIEENITKDFQGLAKKPCDDALALQMSLQHYMELLQLTFNDYCPNFVKAANILDNSVKIYCTKVDDVRNNADVLHDVLITKSDHKKKPSRTDENQDGDDIEHNNDEDAVASVPHALKQARRRRRLKELVPQDEFFEVDNVSEITRRNCNEADAKHECKLPFLERNLTYFVKTKEGRPRIQVCLKKPDDKDESRLRDWVLNSDMMIVRELFSALGMSDASRFIDDEPVHEEDPGGCLVEEQDNWIIPSCPSTPQTPSPDHNDEDACGYTSSSEVSVRCGLVGMATRGELFDIEHVQNKEVADDVIATKKLKPGSVSRPPCEVCNSKKVHKKNGKFCKKETVLGTLYSYFNPLVQPIVHESPYGLLPDTEFLSLYKAQMKTLDHLRRRRAREPSVEAVDHERDAPFAGFDGDDLVDPSEADMDNMLGHNDDDGQFDLPLPGVQGNIPENYLDDHLSDVVTAQQCFERNKQLAVRIAEWHDSLVDKIALSERRGALNMDILATRIMSDFGSDAMDKPKMAFRDLVRNEGRRDIPRFFLTCLQLTNEGNIDIEKIAGSNSEMNILRLRATRLKELDDYTNEAGDTSGRKRTFEEMHEASTKPKAKKKTNKHAKTVNGNKMMIDGS